LKFPSSISPTTTINSDAILAVRGKIAHFEEEGLRKRNFSLGVMNMAFSAYLIGAFPEHYWLFYMFKSIFLVGYKVMFYWYPRKQHYFFLDFCWISNGITFFLFLCILLNVLSKANTASAFLAFFAVANGPLGWSVIMLSNKLVFHNFEWTSTLFIHFSPMVACWGIKWHLPQVEAAWGDRFDGITDINHVGEVFLVGWS